MNRRIEERAKKTNASPSVILYRNIGPMFSYVTRDFDSGENRYNSRFVVWQGENHHRCYYLLWPKCLPNGCKKPYIYRIYWEKWRRNCATETASEAKTISKRAKDDLEMRRVRVVGKRQFFLKIAPLHRIRISSGQCEAKFKPPPNFCN